MLSVQLAPQTCRKMHFPAFDWLDDIPADDWPVHFRGQYSMQLTLGELAVRTGLERHEDILEAFRTWAFAHKGRRYAILWSRDCDAADTVMIAMLNAERARRKGPARDPLAEGWMW